LHFFAKSSLSLLGDCIIQRVGLGRGSDANVTTSSDDFARLDVKSNGWLLLAVRANLFPSSQLWTVVVRYRGKISLNPRLAPGKTCVIHEVW
jgi:hypothetical protein